MPQPGDELQHRTPTSSPDSWWQTKWLSTGYDLFGKDYSASVRRFFNWGLKGRFNESKDIEEPAELERLNEEARNLYRAEP